MEIACWSSKWRPWLLTWAEPRSLARLVIALLLCLILHQIGRLVVLVPGAVWATPEAGAGLALTAYWGPAGCYGWLLGSLTGMLIDGFSTHHIYQLLAIAVAGCSLTQLRPAQPWSPVKFFLFALAVLPLQACWLAWGHELSGHYPFDYMALMHTGQLLVVLLLAGLPTYAALHVCEPFAASLPDTIRRPPWQTIALLAIGPTTLLLSYFYGQHLSAQPVIKAPVMGFHIGWRIRWFVGALLLLHIILLLLPWRRNVPQDPITNKGLGWRSILRT